MTFSHVHVTLLYSSRIKTYLKVHSIVRAVTIVESYRTKLIYYTVIVIIDCLIHFTYDVFKLQV